MSEITITEQSASLSLRETINCIRNHKLLFSLYDLDELDIEHGVSSTFREITTNTETIRLARKRTSSAESTWRFYTLDQNGNEAGMVDLWYNLNHGQVSYIARDLIAQEVVYTADYLLWDYSKPVNNRVREEVKTLASLVKLLD